MKKTFSIDAFIGGALWLSLSAIILKIIGLIYKIPLSHILGDEGMGYFNSAYTVYTFFYILGCAGIPKAISIIVSKNEAEHSFDSHSLFGLCFKAFFFLGCILSLIFVLLTPKMILIIGSEKAMPAMYCVAPSILFICASGAARGYLTGILKLSHIAISELIAGVAKLCLGILLAYYAVNVGYSLPIVCAYAISGISIGSLCSFLYLFAVAKKAKSYSCKIAPTKRTLKDIIKIAFPLTFASAVGSVGALLDLILIMRGLKSAGYSHVVSGTLYGNYTTLALPMFSAIASLITPISTAMLPFITKSFSTNSMDEYSKKINTSLSITALITAPAFFLFLLFPSEILGILFEEGSVKLGFAFLSALAPSVIILGYLTVINTALEATGNVTVPVISLVCGNVTKIFISAVMLRKESIGMLAIPLGTFVAYCVSLLISIAFFRKIKGANVEFFASSVKPFLICGAITIPLMALRNACGHLFENLLFSMIIFLGYGVIYVLLLLIFHEKARKHLFTFVKINKKSNIRL